MACTYRLSYSCGSSCEGEINGLPLLFLTEQLQQIAVTDQTKLRTFTAAAALRHVVAGAVWECAGATTSNASARRKGANYPARADVVFSLAIQLSPESPELIFWLQALSNRDNSDPTVSWLRKELASDWTAINRARGNTISAETGLRTFLTALDGLGREELDDTTKKSLVAAIKLSPAFGLAASRLAFQMAGSKIIQLETGLRWLEIITSESPDILAAWSDRANLYLQNKQPAEAIKCLESLLEKLPNNAQIQEALEAAKSQLKIAE